MAEPGNGADNPVDVRGPRFFPRIGDEGARHPLDLAHAKAGRGQVVEDPHDAAGAAVQACLDEIARAGQGIDQGADLVGWPFTDQEPKDDRRRFLSDGGGDPRGGGDSGNEFFHRVQSLSLCGNYLTWDRVKANRMTRMIDDVLTKIDADLPASLERLFALLRLETISTDPAYRQSVRAGADWLVRELNGMGFEASARETPGHPVVVAHDPGAPERPHVLFYGHYDVQPVDPLDQWQTPPFEPRVAVGADGARRIVGRGAADDKGQLMTFLEACRAWKANGGLPVRVTLLLEGDEESGSTNLGPFLEANAEELRTDVALVCDTNMWDANTPAITIMLRGLVGEEVVVTAADRDLHSGLFGGAARNPIHVLAAVLADLHDADGRVTVPGFYDGVGELPSEVKARWNQLGFSAEAFLGAVGLSLPAGEKGRSALEQVWARPTCEVNGIIGGYTGAGFKTVIASKASAKVSFRLVGNQDPDKIAAAFHDFVRARIPGDCSVEFISHAGNRAISLPFEGKTLSAARKALADEWGREAAIIGSGGSIPVVGDFKKILGVDSLLIGFGLDDDRVHSPNEKYELTSFHKGIRSWARVLGALAG